MPEEVREAVRRSVQRCFGMLPKPVPLRPVSLCLSPDMTRFVPWDGSPPRGVTRANAASVTTSEEVSGDRQCVLPRAKAHGGEPKIPGAGAVAMPGFRASEGQGTHVMESPTLNGCGNHREMDAPTHEHPEVNVPTPEHRETREDPTLPSSQDVCNAVMVSGGRPSPHAEDLPALWAHDARSDAEEQRETRKLQKALREIEALELRQAHGEKLLLNQQWKIDKKTAYLDRLTELRGPEGGGAGV